MAVLGSFKPTMAVSVGPHRRTWVDGSITWGGVPLQCTECSREALLAVHVLQDRLPVHRANSAAAACMADICHIIPITNHYYHRTNY